MANRGHPRGTSAPRHQPFVGVFTAPAKAPKPDHRQTTPRSNTRVTAVCPICGATVSTRLQMGVTFGRRTREISKHRPGGGQVSVRRADPACSGEGSLVEEVE